MLRMMLVGVVMLIAFPAFAFEVDESLEVSPAADSAWHVSVWPYSRGAIRVHYDSCDSVNKFAKFVFYRGEAIIGRAHVSEGESFRLPQSGWMFYEVVEFRSACTVTITRTN